MSDPIRTPAADVRGLVLRYGGAVLAVAAAAGLRWLLHDVFGGTPAYITFHLLVALVAMLAGGGPGVLAAVLSGVVVDVWIIAPGGDHDAADAVGMGLFAASCLVMCAMGEMLRRARRRERAWLEEQVAARTADLQRANARLQREVEDRQRAERSLGKTERRFRTVFEHAATGIAITSLDAEFEQCNPAYCALLGYTEEEFPRIPFASLVHPDDREANLAEICRLRAGEVPSFEIENRYVHRSGRPVWVRKWVSLLPDEAGKPEHLMALVTDMTGRRRAEQALRDSEDRFKTLAGSAPVGIFETDADGNCLFVNDRWCRKAGMTPEAARGLGWADALHPEDRDRVFRSWYEAARAGREFAGEYRFRTPGGTVTWLAGRAVAIRDAAGAITGYIGTVTDVTERKQAEEAVRRSEERVRAILDTAADAVITINGDGVIQSVNPAAERMFGYAAAEMTARNVSMLVPSPYQQEHNGYLARHGQSGVAHVIGTGREVEARRKDGTVFPVELAVSEVDHLPLFTWIVRDITRRKELERDVVEVVSLEQRRIGQDLHDSVAQELTALSLSAGDLAETLRTDPSGGGGLVERMARGLQRSQEQLRAVMRGLLPVAVDAGGLMAALADLADRTGREGKVACTFDCPEPISVTDNVVATQVYLIAQEAARNALKHARPRHIRITLEANSRLALRVRDDGSGMPARPTELQGLGLRIMRNRAAIIGAALTIVPAEPTGTVVTCILARERDE